MVERTPVLNILTHAILLGGVLLLALPVYLTFVAATHTMPELVGEASFLVPGDDFFANIAEAWNRSDFATKFTNTFIVATVVATGKVVIAGISAFAIVFFRYRIRMLLFWLIFITLMLPLEIRIVPTYAVAANALAPFQTILEVTGLAGVVEALTGIEVALEWRLLNSYTGLTLPLIATATGTFLYRQFFLTIPGELVEAAKMDGAGPLRFLRDVLAPLSKTNMAALATIMFVFAWNQYLWPLLITTDHDNYGTVIIELKRLIPGFDSPPEYNIATAGALLVMLPPLVVVIAMQRWFVRGLINH